MHLPARLEERRALEQERDAEHHVVDQEAGLLGLAEVSWVTPCQIETTAPAVKSPNAAIIDQAYVARP